MLILKARTWVEFPNFIVDERNLCHFFRLHHTEQAMLIVLMQTLKRCKRKLKPNRILAGKGWSRRSICRVLKKLTSLGYINHIESKLTNKCKTYHNMFTQLPLSYIY